jgi:hypothetical protein
MSDDGSALTNDTPEVIDPSTTDDVAREILSYLLRHPDAADNLEGLVRWRLVEETVRRTLGETERAVQWLVARGWVREVAHPHAAILFTLDETRRDEAARFLDR